MTTRSDEVPADENEALRAVELEKIQKEIERTLDPFARRLEAIEIMMNAPPERVCIACMHRSRLCVCD